MNAISNDDVRIINWIKSARVGATKIMLASTGYFAEHKKRNQLFYQPTNGDAEDFCKTEIDTMLRDVACMRDIFPDVGKKSKNNTQTLKQFLGSTLRVLGGNTPTNFRRYSSHVNYYDEAEAFTHDVGGEGSFLLLGDKRLEGAIFPKSIRMTTPKLKYGSIIEGEVKLSDYYFKYHVPCPHCHEKQVLKWGGKECSYGFKWDEGKPETCFYLCEHNGCVIKNNDLYYMNENGIWRDEDSGVQLDAEGRFFDNNNVDIPTPSNISFHIWTAYSPWVQWAQFVSEFIIAMDLIAKDGETTKLKTFCNTTLGETWDDSNDAERLDGDILYSRREHYPIKGFSKRGLAIFGGMDMQDDRVEGSVYAVGLDNETFLLEHFILRGDPSQSQLWDTLHVKMTTTYMREDGQEIPVSRWCFDSAGHFTTEVYDFSKQAGEHFVIPTKGASVYGEPLITYPRKRNKHGVLLTMIGTDTGKDIVYNRLKLINDDNDKPSPGYYHFPIAEWCNKGFFAQLCSEVKIPKKTSRGMVMVYDAGSRRNEAIDCAVLALSAYKISIDHYGLNLSMLAEKVEHPERNTKVKNSFLDVAKRLNRG